MNEAWSWESEPRLMVCVSGGGFLLVGNTVRFSKVGPGIRGSVLKSSCKLGGVGLVTEGWARSVAQRVFFLDGYQVRKERGSFLRANAALGAPSANWDPSARCPVMRYTALDHQKPSAFSTHLPAAFPFAYQAACPGLLHLCSVVPKPLGRDRDLQPPAL